MIWPYSLLPPITQDSQSPRGWELYRVGNGVMSAGKPYYSHPDHDVYDSLVFNKMLVSTVSDRDIVWVNGAKLNCYKHNPNQQQYLQNWAKQDIPGMKPIFRKDTPAGRGVAIGTNAVVVAMDNRVEARSISDGKVMWAHDLVSPPVPWGIAMDRAGRIIVSCRNGKIVSFSSE